MTHMEHLSSSDISSVISVAQQTEYAKIFLNEYNAQDKELIEKYKNGDTEILFISESNGNAQLTHEFKDNDDYKNKYTEKDPEKISKDDRLIFGEFTAEQLTDITGDKSRRTAETKNRILTAQNKYNGMQKELLALQVYEQYPDTFKESTALSDDLKSRIVKWKKSISRL